MWMSSADDSFVSVAFPGLRRVLHHVRDVVLLVHADEQVRHRTLTICYIKFGFKQFDS